VDKWNGVSQITINMRYVESIKQFEPDKNITLLTMSERPNPIKVVGYVNQILELIRAAGINIPVIIT
jgi:hypothetical protein